MASLLGQFFPLIKGSQEDIASKGFAYILQISETARNAFNKCLFNSTNIIFENISYITQSIGQNLERPDISGIDNNGKEVIIIEAKFWANLTSNQPIEYLKRLKDNSVLVFICPKLREISLFEEIDLRLKTANIECEVINNIFKLQNNVYIQIINWNSLLNFIKQVLLQNNENISDVEQIIGFCEIIDNSTFLPISDSDLSPSIAKRINSYCDLIDKVIDNLKIEASINMGSLKATGQKYGYTRYFMYNNFGNSLDVSLKYWGTTFDTPFWLTIKNIGDKSWYQSNELKNKLKSISIKTNIKIHEIDGIYIFSIIPKINSIEENVIKGITNDINNILKEL
jgi:hypothetical protein